LPARLLGELPADEYRVALVLHPNVWYWHSQYQVRLWLANGREAGLLLVPPSGGWQAALVAADVVVGDHGSVTMYAAALDRPVMLAGDQATARIVPGTPPEELIRTAHRLNDSPALAQQVAEAIDEYRPGQFAGLADRMFARPGEAAQAFQDLLYNRLGLAAPQAAPALRAVGVPRPEVNEPCSFVVFSRMRQPGEVSLWRFPSAVRNAGAPDPEAVRHLCVGDEEPDRRLPANASVIVRRAVTSHRAAEAWITETFRRYPGPVVVAAAVSGGCVAGIKGGQRIRITMPSADPALAASAVYACLREGQPTSGPVTVRTGSTSVTATLGPHTAP
jgi:hypothetical protein